MSEEEVPSLQGYSVGRDCSPRFSTSRLSCVSESPGSPSPPSPPPPGSSDGVHRFFLEHLPLTCLWGHLLSQRKEEGWEGLLPPPTPNLTTPPCLPAPHPASPIHVSGMMPSALGNSGLGIILPDLVETRTRSPASLNLHSTSVGFLVDRKGEPGLGASLPAALQPKIQWLKTPRSPSSFSATSVLGLLTVSCP